MSGATVSKRVLKNHRGRRRGGRGRVLAPGRRWPRRSAPPLDPISIRIGANAGFTRIEFAGVIGARSRVRREGRDVIVRIGSTAAPDVSRLKVDPPPGVEKVETRAVQGAHRTGPDPGRGRGRPHRLGRRRGLAEPLSPAAPDAPPAGRASPAATWPVAAHGHAGRRSRLTFAWAAPVGAAVFRRGEAVWIVFDTAARHGHVRRATAGPGRRRPLGRRPGLYRHPHRRARRPGGLGRRPGRDLDRDHRRPARRRRRACRGRSRRQRRARSGRPHGRRDQGRSG